MGETRPRVRTHTGLILKDTLRRFMAAVCLAVWLPLGLGCSTSDLSGATSGATGISLSGTQAGNTSSQASAPTGAATPESEPQIPDPGAGASSTQPTSGPGAAVAIAAGSRWETRAYVQNPGSSPTVVIVGGMHGAEIAGFTAGDEVQKITVRNGRLIVIPRVNVLGIKNKSRAVEGTGVSDCNRGWPSSSSEAPKGFLAQEVWKFLVEQKPDWVIDMHEGFAFHLESSWSMGSSILYCSTVGPTPPEVDSMLSAVNKPITDPQHKFSILRMALESCMSGSTGAVLNARSMIVETTRPLPLSERVNQHVTIVRQLLSELQMI